jgi:hypothetical protein
VLKDIVANHARALTSLDCHQTKVTPQSVSYPLLVNSPNWSGYIASAASGTTPLDAAAQSWTVPTLYQSASTNPTLSTWVGVGSGKNDSHQLVQAGVYQYVEGNTGYSAFFVEVVPQDPELIEVDNLSAGFYPALGDSVSVIVGYDSASDPPEADFYIFHRTTNLYVNITQAYTGTIGTQAEWIGAERVKNGNYYTQLVDFSADNVTEAQAAPFGGPAQNAGTFTPQRVRMLDCASPYPELATTTALSNQENFTTKWKAGGKYEPITPCDIPSPIAK